MARRRRYHLRGGVNDGILGDDNFVKSVREETGEIKARDFFMDDLLTVVCDHYKVDTEALSSPGKGRNTSKVRGILALLVSKNDHLTLEDLGVLVNRDPSGLSRQAKRLEVDSQKSKELKSEILSIESSLIQMS